VPLNQAYGFCPNCSQWTSDRNPRRRRDGTYFYRTSCRACDNRMSAEQRRRRQAAPRVPATRLGVERKFGVEIECNIPGGLHGGAAEELNATLPVGWRLKYDGSLGNRGVEVVSPPMRGADGFEQLRTACQAIKDVGGTVDSSCGLHVHHEIADVGAAGLARFVVTWQRHQNLLDWLVSPSRRSEARNTYCEGIENSEAAAMENWARRVANDGDARHRSPAIASRYKAVNVWAYPRFGTVEVRTHQGTLSFRKIEAWVLLGQGMLDAVAVQGAAVMNRSTLQDFFAAIELDEDASAYLLGRAVQFGAPNEVVN
jgi:Putative amidoligase enzyme